MEPLVLIHGFSGIPAMWDPMLPALQEQFDVRALGLAGHFGCAALPEGTDVSTTALFDAIRRDGPPSDFDGIECPTTIVWGTKDRIIPLKGYSDRIRRMVPQADFVVLEGAGHSPMVDEPDRLVRIIEETASRAREGVAAGDPAA